MKKEKIHVIYNGVGNSFFPIDEQEKREIKKMFSSGSDYFIFIGSIHKRKNISNLLKGFGLYKEKNKIKNKVINCGQKKMVV